MAERIRSQALQGALWHDVDAGPRSQSLALCHYGMAQRWRVGCSQAARERAEKSVRHAQHRAGEALKKPLFHLPAKRCETPAAAQAALAAVSKAWRSHQGDTHHLREHKRDERQGRPSAEPPIKAIAGQMAAHVRPDQTVLEAHQQPQACYGIGTNSEASPLSDGDIITASTSQSQAEGRCRFLKDPLFFVSALFVQKPRRMQGLRMVMTLALLVYAVTQRRLRKQ